MIDTNLNTFNNMYAALNKPEIQFQTFEARALTVWFEYQGTSA